MLLIIALMRSFALAQVAAFWPGRQAEPAQVGYYHRVIGGEIDCQWRPHVAGLTIPMQQDYGRPVASDPDMDQGVISLDPSGVELLREGLRLCARGQIGGQHADGQRRASFI